MYLLIPPKREYGIIAITCVAIFFDIVFQELHIFLIVMALLGSLPTVISALHDLTRKKVTIDIFNTFALVIGFATSEIRSVAFIVLMLAFARLLDWHTESKTKNAVEELLKLKPQAALLERGGAVLTVPVNTIQENDVLVIQNGARIPVDGVVMFGSAKINEAIITGESALREKVVGDQVFGSTLNESGTLKIRATKVGADSTIERMASLMREAAANKSRSEKLADKFAGIFLPVVLLMGALTYALTKNISITAALFLVACADDMAVAIPLAMTASLGKAATRGVIIKGGEWLDVLGKIKIVVFDKTGTLTYGTPTVSNVGREPHITVEQFWKFVGIAEKFSEHPLAKAVLREAVKHTNSIPDPEEFTVEKGCGIIARYQENRIIIGNKNMLSACSIPDPEKIQAKLRQTEKDFAQTTFMVIVNDRFAGTVSVADIPRVEAKNSIAALYQLGIERIIIFTGDNEAVARTVAENLGIKEFRASLTPEEKLRAIEALATHGPVAMIGDGVNDSPALARADVGIAIGSGSSISVEAADVVILNDDLTRIPETIVLGRKAAYIIRGDMIIWALSNVVGFALVFTGVLGPALAALYNFLTDFFPLFNSSRLFAIEKNKTQKFFAPTK